MILTTTNALTSAGYVIERGTGERIQFWRRSDPSGEDSAVIHDETSGRTWRVNGDGRTEAVVIACATVGLGAVAASSLPVDVKDAQSKIIIDSLEHL